MIFSKRNAWPTYNILNVIVNIQTRYIHKCAVFILSEIRLDFNKSITDSNIIEEKGEVT